MASWRSSSSAQSENSATVSFSYLDYTKSLKLEGHEYTEITPHDDVQDVLDTNTANQGRFELVRTELFPDLETTSKDVGSGNAHKNEMRKSASFQFVPEERQFYNSNLRHSFDNSDLRHSFEDNLFHDSTTIDSALENEDFVEVEKLALSLWRLARAKQRDGIKRLLEKNNVWSKSRPPSGPSSDSSMTLSRANSLSQEPNSKVKYSFSTFSTSIREENHGLVCEQNHFRPNTEQIGAKAQDQQIAKNLLKILEPMMVAAAKQTTPSASPALNCSDVHGLKRGLLSAVESAKRKNDLSENRITANEPRLLKLPSPCSVLGDIHGNLADLAFFKRILWPAGLTAATSDILFLGDYVDRGLESIAVVAYLMAMKIMYPTKWWLIRGNHETRDVNGNQDQYKAGSFLTQCISTFGVMDGRAVWEAVNEFFDTLPMAAVIDDAIFCVHGGISRELCNAQDPLGLINSLPCPMRSFPADKLVHNMLWSDPSLEGQNAAWSLDKDGFGVSPRGSASFGRRSVETFLSKTGLQHVFRGHEAKAGGVEVAMNDLVTTIFSTSQNHFTAETPTSCGCVTVNKGQMHVLIRSPKASAQPPRSDLRQVTTETTLGLHNFGQFVQQRGSWPQANFHFPYSLLSHC